MWEWERQDSNSLRKEDLVWKPTWCCHELNQWCQREIDEPNGKEGSCIEINGSERKEVAWKVVEYRGIEGNAVSFRRKDIHVECWKQKQIGRPWSNSDAVTSDLQVFVVKA